MPFYGMPCFANMAKIARKAPSDGFSSFFSIINP
jgi:hypothetical protein